MVRLATASATNGQPVLSAGQSPAAAGPLPDCNFLRLLATSPAAAEAYLSFNSALSRGQLTPRQRELLALAIAEINGAQYCLSAHYALAANLA